MENTTGDLEQLWTDLLSRQPEVIYAAFRQLDSQSQINVITHLEHMLNDPGWQLEQHDSALAALQVLKNRSRQDK